MHLFRPGTALHLCRNSLGIVAMTILLGQFASAEEPHAEPDGANEIQIYFSNLYFYSLVLKRKIAGIDYETYFALDNERELSVRSQLHAFRDRCGPDGRAELLACITLYNETFDNLQDTLGAFMRGYTELLSINKKR